MNVDHTVVEEDDKNNLLGDDWEWDQWTNIGDDDSVTEPPTKYHCNGINGLEIRVSESFDTIIQCVLTA